ncbi:MAG TPA: hypothetical protein VGO57_03965, partial [Verrucomicrobiae bacterium]
RRRLKSGTPKYIPQPAAQFIIWGGLFLSGCACLFCEKFILAMLLILLAQLFPKSRQVETHEN